MSDRVGLQGLNRIADTASQTSGYSAARYIRTFSVDDSAIALVAGTTTASSPTNFYDQAFDAPPVRSGQVVAHLCTLAAATAPFIHRRILIHDDTVANVTGSSATVAGGIDNLSITKPANVPFEYTLSLTYSNTTP